MSYNTNRQSRKLRQLLGPPNQYKASPWQWGYVAGIHAPRSTTLSAACAAGAPAIETAAYIEANALIVVGNGGPVEVESVSGSGPYTLTLATRGVPFAQASGATVRVLATVDLYLDGWQHPPDNLPVGVTQTLTTGVRYMDGYAPVVGHVVLIARGTGLQRSDRLVLGQPATGQGFLERTGTQAVNFSSGFGSLTFETPFPNTLESIVVSVESDSLGAEISWYNPTTSGVFVALAFNGTGFPGFATISYIAKGT